MTVASEVNRSGPYTGNGVTTVFAYGFRILDQGHIKVIRREGEIETVLMVNTDYTVAGVGDAGGGSITMTVAPTAAQTITIIRKAPFTQETDLVNQGPFFAETIEASLDLATMRDQQLAEQLSRVLSVSASGEAINPLPPASVRANGGSGSLFGFDGVTGQPIITPIASNPLLIASQPEAEAGADNIKVMTPLRVKNAMQNGAFFTQSGAGAVARSFTSKLRDAVSAKDFGAVGDGVADDTAAIQAAVTAVIGAGGGIVYFPRGTYKITSQVNIDADAVHLVGAGEQATSIALASAAQNGLVFGNGAVTRYNVGARDMRLITSAVTKTAGASIHFNNCGQIRCQNIRTFYQFEGVRLTSVVVAFVQNMYMVNPVPVIGRGIFITGGNDQYLQNILVAGNVAAQPETGIYVEATGGLWLDTVGAIWSSVGLRLNPAPGGTIENVFSRACAWDTNGGYGEYINAPAGTTVRRVQSLGDWFASNAADGLIVQGAGTITDIDLVSPRAYNNGNHGLRFEAGSDISLVDPHAAGNSQAASGNYHGILFNNALNGFSIVGGRSRQFGGFGNTQGYGVVINSAAADNYLINGIDVRGNAAGGILTAATVGSTRIIRNCLGYTTEVVGSTSATTDASGDIVVTHGLVGTPRFIFLQLSGAANVATYQPHTFGATTFKVRFWNPAGAPLASTAVGVLWRASI